MTDLIESREAATDSPDTTHIHEQFSPLCERAVRSDGTIGVKIIQPGWGSSGYYPREVLERDIPRVFPKGTQNFWNHDTMSEEMERPEGDLSRLASVFVSDPVWLDNGAKGPGMYADAKVFPGYAESIDAISDYIGMSIRASGRHTSGEAEGRQGRIIQEITPDPRVGARVDYVTAAGAGGAIVSIFESAPGSGALPDPITDNVQAFLKEAGRVLSLANETKLRTALEQLTAVLTLLDSGEVSENATQLQIPLEDDMELEQELKEAQATLATKDQELQESLNALAKMQEQLLLREARDFVADSLSSVDLPDVTKTRLARELVANPSIKEGRIDQDVYKLRVATAVTEAQTEIAQLLGTDGRIEGNGESLVKESVTPIKESITKLDRVLAAMGHGGVA